MADDAINLKVASPCWIMIKSNRKLPGSSEQPGGHSLEVRSVKAQPTLLPPAVANVTLSPHQSERSPLALLAPLPLPPGKKSNPGHPRVTESHTEIHKFTKSTATVRRLGQRKIEASQKINLPQGRRAPTATPPHRPSHLRATQRGYIFPSASVTFSFSEPTGPGGSH